MKAYIIILSLALLLPIYSDDTVTTQKTPAYPPVPDEIKTADYHDYTGCKLVRVEPDGVVISHTLGIAKLLFVKMPEDFQKAYGYDPVAAKTAMDAQAAKNAASDAAAVKQIQVISKTNNQASIAEKDKSAKTQASIQSQVAALQSQISTLQTEADKLDAEEKRKYEDRSNLRSNSFGQLEHRYSLGHNQQADDDRSQIVALQQQITDLQNTQ